MTDSEIGGEAPHAGPAEVADVDGETGAAREALANARAAARAKGLRPGTRPRRRRRDLPEDARGSGGRDPQLLGDEVAALVSGRGWGAEVAIGAVIGRWPQIVGAQIAPHCVPVDFTDSVLTVQASSTAWATNLRMMIHTMMASVEREVGQGVVTSIRVVGPSAPSWSRGMRRAQDGRGPRDTYG